MLKEVCSKGKFKLDYQHPEDFTICNWQKRPRVILSWVVYRFTITLFFGLILITAFFLPEKNHIFYKNLFFASFWTGTTQLSNLTLALALSIERYRHQKKNPASPPLDKMPVRFKVLWLLCNLSSSVEIVVSIVFWLVAYRPEIHQNTVRNALLHLCLPSIILLDFGLNAFPYRFLHFYIPVAYTFLYILFTVFYQMSGLIGNESHLPIYTILDWRTPGAAVLTCTIQIVSIILAHATLCLLCMLKSWLRKTETEAEYRPTKTESVKVIEPKPIQSRQSRQSHLSRQSRPRFTSEDSI